MERVCPPNVLACCEGADWSAAATAGAALLFLMMFLILLFLGYVFLLHKACAKGCKNEILTFFPA